MNKALTAAKITTADIQVAGFGVAGFDWPSQKAEILKTLNQFGPNCPLGLVNDGIPPILAAATNGWGISLIAGTDCKGAP